MKILRDFFSDLFGAYGNAAKICLALTTLFIAQFSVEMLQHVVEVQTGFMTAATREGAAMHPLRMLLGWAKMITLYASCFFALRYFLTGDRVSAMRPNSSTLRGYIPVFLWMLLPPMAMIYIYGYKDALGLTGDQAKLFLAVIGLGMMLIEPLLVYWYGRRAVGFNGSPLQSAKITGVWYFWALLLIFIGRVPVSLLHNFLNKYAVDKGGVPLWGLMTIDSVVVAFLAMLMPALYARFLKRLENARDAVGPATDG